jgi:WD repeat and SOF domain-containing protein 1
LCCAVKLDRVFAKPFVGSLDGHMDGVFCLAKHPHKLGWLLSGACDGEVRIWNLATRKCINAETLHSGFVQGLCVTPDGKHMISVGQDKTVRISGLEQHFDSAGVVEGAADEAREEARTVMHKSYFTGVDHHRRQDMFATSGPVVDLWSMHRSEPVSTFSWGADTVTSVKFNPVEVNVLATTADDRNIALYDVRANTPIRKVILGMRTNAICWNPMEVRARPAGSLRIAYVHDCVCACRACCACAYRVVRMRSLGGGGEVLGGGGEELGVQG